MMFSYSEPCRISHRKGQRNLLWQDCRLSRLRRDVSRTNWIVRKLALAWILKSHILHVQTTVCTGNIDLVIENNFGVCISWYFVFQCLQNWNQSDNVRLKDCFHPQYLFFLVPRKRKYGPILNLIIITKGLACKLRSTKSSQDICSWRHISCIKWRIYQIFIWSVLKGSSSHVHNSFIFRKRSVSCT